jgi:hypothetical protein
MNSEKVDLIVTALNKAQTKMRGVLKTAENPFFHSKYATLENFVDAFQEYYLPEGLAFTQTGAVVDGKNYLSTTLWHVSGQWISSMYPLTPVKTDPQAMGASVTYARRYDLAAITGMPTSDDDGELAMDRPPTQQPVPKKGIPEPDSGPKLDCSTGFIPTCPIHGGKMITSNYCKDGHTAYYYCNVKGPDGKYCKEKGDR